MAAVTDVGVQLKGWFQAQPVSRRLFTVVILTLTIAFVAVFAVRYKEGNMELLYGRLTEEDAGGILKKLQTMNVECQTREGGAIYVPRGTKYDLRAELAAEGLPHSGGGVGYEIFDKSQLGATDFVQKVNRQRAIRGELQRTINSLSVVRSSRVTIQAPEPSPFLGEEREPSASVVVELAAGQRLMKNQVRGIATIVASAIPGLTLANVEVINNRGELLSTPDNERLTDETTQQLVHQRNYERKVKRDIEDILERWFGRGHVVAQVSAQFDFSQMEQTIELYEDDNRVLTSERVNRQLEQTISSVEGGSSGLDSGESVTELAAIGDASGGGQVTVSNTYLPGRTFTRTQQPVGKLTNLQVAVLVDQLFDFSGAEGEQPTDEALTKKRDTERTQIEEAVKKTMGFVQVDDRQDEVTVSFVPFNKMLLPTEELDETKLVWQEQTVFWIRQLISIGLPTLIILLFFAFVLRPYIKFLDKQHAEKMRAEARLKTVAELEATLGSEGQIENIGASIEGAAEKVRQQQLAKIGEDVNSMAQEEPQKSAKTIRRWLES